MRVKRLPLGAATGLSQRETQPTQSPLGPWEAVSNGRFTTTGASKASICSSIQATASRRVASPPLRGVAVSGGQFCFNHEFPGIHTAKIGLNYRFNSAGRD